MSLWLMSAAATGYQASEFYTTFYYQFLKALKLPLLLILLFLARLLEGGRQSETYWN